MKAITFFEYFGLSFKDKLEYLDSIGHLIPEGYENDDIDDTYYKYLNKAFKPEYITALFSGWNYDGKDRIYENVYYTDNYIEMDNADLSYTVDGEIGFLFPRTLDDFINDCQRAGIELEWRKG